MILVTHNLGIVAELADRVEVMYAGRIVEEGTARELISNPRHPYTKALLSAVPVLGEKDRKLRTIPGIVPSPCDYPPGCRFCGRCEFSGTRSAADRERCRAERPELRPAGDGGHACACHFFDR